MTVIGLAEGIENGVGMEPNQMVGKSMLYEEIVALDDKGLPHDSNG